MAQKAKREGEKSPPSGVSLLEQPSSEGPATVDVDPPTSQEKLPAEKKSSGGEGISPGELLDLEQQKLAGKRKGWPIDQLVNNRWRWEATSYTFSFLFEGANKPKWVPLSLDPPARPPPSKGSHRGDRHREYDRVHRDRVERTGEGVHRDNYKDGQPHKDRDGYRDGYRGGDKGYQSHYYKYGGGSGHDRGDNKEREQYRDRRGGDRYNLPPRYTNQPQGQDYPGGGGGGGVESGGSGGSGMFEGNNRYGGRGGRPGRGGGRSWRYPSPGSGHSESKALCLCIMCVK